MVAKLAMLILVMALTAASLLVVRQQRLQAVREMADAAERAANFDRTLWRVRVEIAKSVTPGQVAEMARTMGPMQPIPVPWGLPALAASEPPADRVADASDETVHSGGGGGHAQ
jgi:hypothetical protein